MDSSCHTNPPCKHCGKTEDRMWTDFDTGSSERTALCMECLRRVAKYHSQKVKEKTHEGR